MGTGLFLKGFTLGFVVLAVVGCASASPTFPAGEFIDNEGFVTSFMADGRFSVKSSITGEIFVENGQYSIDGDTITFYETEQCAPVEGVYKWTLEGDRLLLEPTEDKCISRSMALIRGLTRYNQGE